MKATIAAAVVLPIAAFLWLRWTGGTLLASARQPGGVATAEARLRSFAAATDADTLVVQIRRGWLLPPAIIFEAADYGGGVSVSWAGPKALVIHLKNPERLRVYRAYRHWQGLNISYPNADQSPGKP